MNNSSRLLTTKEILETQPVGRTKLYMALEKGDLRSVKWGRKYLIRSEDWEDFLAQNEHALDSN